MPGGLGGTTDGTVYTDLVTAKMGMLPASNSDAMVANDSGRVGMGLLPYGSEALTYSDVTTVLLGMNPFSVDMCLLPGGHTSYADTSTAMMGMNARAAEQLYAKETPAAKMGMLPSATDFYRPFSARFYFDLVQVRMGCTALSFDSVVEHEICSTLMGFVANSVDTCNAHDTSSTRIGMQPHSADGWQTGDVSIAKLGMNGASSDRLRGSERPATLMGVRASVAEILVSKDTPTARAAMAGRTTENLSASEMPTARAAMAGRSTDTRIGTMTSTARGGFTPQSATDGARYTDVCTAKMGTKPSCTEVKVSTDVCSVHVGVRPIQTDAWFTSDVVTAIMALSISSTEHQIRPIPLPAGSSYSGTITADNLIEACRLLVEATLTEIKKIPEALDQSPALTTGKLPFLVMQADEPSDADGYQVRSVAQKINIDFIYVRSTATDGTDTTQDIRERLATLESAFYSNFHLSGLVTNLETIAVPAQKSNTYEQYFKTKGAAVDIMVLTLAFTLVRDV